MSGELSVAALERYAIWYMERYPASTDRVRRALLRRAKRVDPEGDDPRDAIEAVIERLRGLRLLDDARLARARVVALRARGKSARAIRHQLRGQGLSASDIDRALGDSTKDDELEAARRYLGRRRARRRSEPDETRRERDLAALSRAGFDYDVARRVLDE